MNDMNDATMHKTADRIIAGVFTKLEGLKGFDRWWSDITGPDKLVVLKTLRAEIAPHLEELVERAAS